MEEMEEGEVPLVHLVPLAEVAMVGPLAVEAVVLVHLEVSAPAGDEVPHLRLHPCMT